MLRFARRLRLTDTMEEFEFTRYVVPLRDRMFRYAQSLLLCADEAEDVTHDLLERLWRERDRLDGCRDVASFVMVAVRNCCYDRFRSRQDIEGYPTREIAGMVACDEAQVRVILSRARNALRGILKKMMDDERAGRKN